MVKFKFLAHFPVDHLAHPVMSSLVLLLCQFAAFAYYVIDGFISVTACVALQKNATCYYDHILKEIPHEIVAVELPTSHLTNHSIKMNKHSEHSGRSKE